ncbi:MAG TPA: outer membrane protein assembly factor BamD [Vicinamibacterales bacterium]|jgi:outer membrane protein assembly factor BamD|nr:outer membrane protein assembly factor BamD [Vicinamibacterales bacterium]
MVVFDPGARMTPRPVRMRALAVIALALVVGACATGGARKPPTGTPDPDKFLFDRGTDALNKKHWVVAREYFRQLVDTYPQSPYRADAKLGLGDSYLGESTAENFVLAVNEYREFLSFYPTNPRADYAQFKLAMAHYYQMRKPERDQSETREAIAALQTFVDRYPRSALAEEGRQRLREAKDRLDDSDFRVGLFYYRAKWYPGAIDRLKPLLDRDPEYTRRDAVYYYLAESYVEVKKEAEALPLFERLVKEFEQSEFLEPSKKRIDELKTSLAAKK